MITLQFSYAYPITTADLREWLKSVSSTGWEWSETNGWVSSVTFGFDTALDLGHNAGPPVGPGKDRRELFLVMRTKKVTIPPMGSRCKPVLLFLCAVFLSNPSVGQTEGVPTRIKQPVDETRRTVLRGDTHPSAQPLFDLGT